jgi:hypothetical protein
VPFPFYRVSKRTDYRPPVGFAFDEEILGAKADHLQAQRVVVLAGKHHYWNLAGLCYRAHHRFQTANVR